MKVKLNWLRVPATYFLKQKCRTRGKNPSSSDLMWKARKNPPKSHTKNRPFVLCKISKDRMCHIISSRLESSEKVGFGSDGSSFIVDNSENSHICSEEDMSGYSPR